MVDHPEMKTRRSRRQAVVALIRNFEKPFTTGQMWKACAALPSPISRATLYRILHELRDEGTLKEIFLPHGQQILIYTDSPIVCLVECLNCGRYISSPKLASRMAPVIKQSKLDPVQTAVFLRSHCLNIKECKEARGA